jgi:large subunit ribosomal protein L30
MDSPKPEANAKRIRLTLMHSALGNTKRHKNTVRSLGLRRLNQTVEVTDSPNIRGMLAKVAHLVKVEEL